VLCCETRCCHARRHNGFEGHSNFSSRPIFSILCLEQLWRSTVAFTYRYLKVKSFAFVCFRWSCYFVLGLVSSCLGLILKNLVLFTSLEIKPCVFDCPTLQFFRVRTVRSFVRHRRFSPLIGEKFGNLLRFQVETSSNYRLQN